MQCHVTLRFAAQYKYKSGRMGKGDDGELPYRTLPILFISLTSRTCSEETVCLTRSLAQGTPDGSIR